MRALLALALVTLLSGCVTKETATPLDLAGPSGPFEGGAAGLSSTRTPLGHAEYEVDGSFHVSGGSPVKVTLIADEEDCDLRSAPRWTAAPFVTKLERTIVPANGEAPFRFTFQLERGLLPPELSVYVLGESEGATVSLGCHSAL